MKSIYCYFILLCCLCLWRTEAASAQSMVAGEITYTSLSRSQIIAHLRIVRICNSTGMPDLSKAQLLVKTKDPATGTFSDSFVQLPLLDSSNLVNEFCNNGAAFCDGTANVGNFIQLRYEDTLEVDPAACEFRLDYNSCCLYAGITTGPGTFSHRMETIIYNCYGPNISAKPVGSGVHHWRVGEEYSLNLGMFDLKETDTLVFSLVNFMDSTGTGYFSSGFGAYNYQKPIRIKAGVKFELDSLTGDINFTPFGDDISILSVKTDEYKRDPATGQYHLVAQITRLHFLNVRSLDPNTNGVITGARWIKQCWGDPFNLNISVRERELSDSTYISLDPDYAREGISYTYDDSTRKSIQVAVDSGYFSTHQPGNLRIIVNTTDARCPRGTSSLEYRVFFSIRDSINLDGSLSKRTAACNNADFRFWPVAGIDTSRLSYKWQVDGKTYTGRDSIRVSLPDSGWHYVTLEVQRKTVSCSLDSTADIVTFRDSIFIAAPPFSFDILTPDTVLCTGGIITLRAGNPRNGKAPYNILWQNNGSNAQQTLALINYDQQWVVIVTDSSGCVATDTVNISLSTYKKPVLIHPGQLCTAQDTVRLYTGGTTQPGNWSGLHVDAGGLFHAANAGDGLHTVYFRQTGDTVCGYTDSLQIRVTHPDSLYTVNRIDSTCSDSALNYYTFHTSRSGGKWSGPVAVDSVLQHIELNKLPSGRHVFYVDFNAGVCSKRDSVVLEHFHVPSLPVSPPVKLCINAGRVVVPKPFANIHLNGPGILFDSIFDPAAAGPGNHVVIYSWYWSASCAASGTLDYIVSDTTFGEMIRRDSMDCFNDVYTLPSLGGQWLDIAPTASNKVHGNWLLPGWNTFVHYRDTVYCGRYDTLMLYVPQRLGLIGTLIDTAYQGHRFYLPDYLQTGGSLSGAGVAGDSVDLGVLPAPGLNNYYYTLSSGGCIYTDTLRLLILPGWPSGIQEQLSAPGISWWPNPAADVLYLQHEGPGTVGIRLVDALGRICLELRAEARQTTVADISGLGAGVYLLQDTNGTGIGRVIIRQ